MEKERNCITPFIRRVQSEFSKGKTPGEIIAEIPRYQKLASRIYDVNVYCFHQFAVSSFFLSSLIYYESMRQRGAPLPDSNSLVTTAARPINAVASRLLRHNRIDPKHEVIERSYNRDIAA